MLKTKRIGCFLPIMLFILLSILLWRDPSSAPGTYGEADALIAAFCEAHTLRLSDYPEELRALLERNPETADYVLHYPLEKDAGVTVDLSKYEDCDGVPLFLQWDRQWGYLEYGSKPVGLTGCAPMCLSMAAYYLTGDDAFSPDRIIEFADQGGYYIPGSGSSWTLIREGAPELGFAVTELPLVKSRIFDHLDSGEPVICAMGPGDFTTSGHFILLVGVEDGLLRINDPNSAQNSEKLWRFEDIESQFRNLWAIRLP